MIAYGQDFPDPLADCSPLPTPYVGEQGAPLYTDIAALLDGGLPDPPQPILLHREDGRAVFYAEQVNYVFGHSESGKTFIAIAAVVEALAAGRRALILDMDHNGATAIVGRLLDLGAKPEALADADLFRYAEPEDAEHLDRLIADASAWRPAVAVVDSIGELLPLLHLSSNSPDDFTEAHARALKPLAKAGSAVIAIDHLAKNADSQAQGASGTAAKRRAVGGTSLRVTVKEQFSPGRGGSCYLAVHKDRHGGLRAHCPADAREPSAGVFELMQDGDVLTWRVTAPRVGESHAAAGISIEDLAELDALDPPPKSQRDVKDRMGWGSSKALAALNAWRQVRSGSAPQEQGAECSPLPTPYVRSEEQPKSRFYALADLSRPDAECEICTGSAPYGETVCAECADEVYRSPA